MLSICRLELEVGRRVPVFPPYSSTPKLHETRICNHRDTTNYHKYKKELSTLSTMSHAQPQMIWNSNSRRGKQPPSNIKTNSNMIPPPDMETVTTSSSSSSLSQATSINIGEFSMNPAWRGTTAAFSMAVKDDLFPKVKFLHETNASLDFSKDKTSICGFLQSCCGMSDDDAYHWW
jgi:hypothetical protein